MMAIQPLILNLSDGQVPDRCRTGSGLSAGLVMDWRRND